MLSLHVGRYSWIEITTPQGEVQRYYPHELDLARGESVPVHDRGQRVGWIHRADNFRRRGRGRLHVRVDLPRDYQVLRMPKHLPSPRKEPRWKP